MIASAPVRAGAVERPEVGWATAVAEGDNVEIAMVVAASVRPGGSRADRACGGCVELSPTLNQGRHTPRDANCDARMTVLRIHVTLGVTPGGLGSRGNERAVGSAICPTRDYSALCDTSGCDSPCAAHVND